MDTAKYFQNGLPELAEIWYIIRRLTRFFLNGKGGQI
jgi:hypothetical protein